MKVLYLDCGMGAAGDMLTAALLELLPEAEREAFLERLAGLVPEGVSVSAEKTKKCGITGTHMRVLVDGMEEEDHDHSHDHHHEEEHDHHHDHGPHHRHEGDHDHEEEHHHHHEDGHHHHHAHSGMGDIRRMAEAMDVSGKVREDILAVYGLIAEAESHAHDCPVEEIHFHEVGTKDAVTDVLAVCLLMEMIGPDRVIASPVHVGSGHVRCAHGILPVPAPAAAWILRDVPIYGGKIKGELCTPTGAALLKHFADEFGDMPVMKTSAIGYGMGKRDFPVCNAVRALLGETEGSRDRILELSCNVDDMTGEEMGYAMEALLEAGARDVSVTPIIMKKSRPGLLLRVICTEETRTVMVEKIFRLTATIGIRELAMDRYVLDRREDILETPYGKVRRKISTGYGVTRAKAEYEDLAAIAAREGISIRDIPLE